MANKARTRNGARSASADASTKTKGAPPARISATKDGGVAGVNRRERKEEARRQREALLRKQARRRVYRIATIAGAAILALVLVLVFAVFKKSTPPSSFDQSKLPGLIKTTTTRLWEVPNTQDLDQRVNDMGLPGLGTEQLVFHIHQKLFIYVGGTAVTVPQGIGIASPADLAVIHTHTPDGVIHVESPDQRDYTLGQFFGVWGLNFTPTSIGGYRDGNGKTLRVYVNGKLVNGDPSKIVLKSHEVIVVTFGTAAQLPNPIPSTYKFPNGE